MKQLTVTGNLLKSDDQLIGHHKPHLLLSKIITPV